VNHIHVSSSLARFNFAFRFIFKAFMCITYPYAHAIVTVSHGVAEDLARFIRLPSSRIRVIYNPVIGTAPLKEAPNFSNHPWLGERNYPLIVAVGRLTAQKDFGMLLRSLALMRHQSAARLIILGEGEQREELQHLAAELGLSEIVDMPGFVPNPCSYMAHATVVALSSRWEALPTVLIEAMACGTRVVSTDCPSGPSEVLAGGKYGRLVPVGDAAAMASALLDVVQGKVAPPPPESWKPYLIEKVAEDYLALFGAPA
jgi:glycosyltransferase involved in cell wall biosynthesis